MMRILSIDNLSARAYRLCTPEFPHTLRFESPARVHALMAAGQCDAALLPVASLAAFSDVADTAGSFGIACTGPVRSVQLFTQTPLVALLQARQPIYATPKSRTSVQLFTILCEQHYGGRPHFTSSYTGAAGHLLIGDAAFEYALRTAGGQHHVDLGAWWLAHTGLPFVFARWVIARSAGAPETTALLRWLDACAEWSATPAGIAELARRAGTAPRDHGALVTYYQQLRTRLSEADLAGQSLFQQLMEGHSHALAAPVA